MPMRHVYGKRTKQSALVPPVVFSWSSSPEQRDAQTHSATAEPVHDITQSLEKLRLAQEKEENSTISPDVLKVAKSDAVIERNGLHGAAFDIPQLQNPLDDREPLSVTDGNASSKNRKPKRNLHDSEKLGREVRKSPRLKNRYGVLQRPLREQSSEELDCKERENAKRCTEEVPKTSYSQVRHPVRCSPALRFGAEDYTSVPPTCSQTIDKQEPVTFAEWTEEIADDFEVTKIAEATYAQVFLLSRKEPTGIPHDDRSILKVLSLNPPRIGADELDRRPAKVRETSSDFDKVAAEVRLLDRMTEIPGFTNLREVRLLKGRPTAPINVAWRGWNKSRRKGDKSFFPDPSRKTNYGDEQLWAVIEMDHAGLDLEHPDTHIDSVWAVWDVFWSVAIALAKGEEEVRFEHRDLHLGNICILSPDSPDLVPPAPNRKLGFTRLETTIIDYTLSRAEIEAPVGSHYPNPEVVYIDLDEEAVFDGDASVNYQYEIYRLMRSAVFLRDPRRDFARYEAAGKLVKTSWRESHLQTNLIWLYFILSQLYANLQRDGGSCNISHVQVSPLTDRADLTKRRDELDATLRAVLDRLHPEYWKFSGLRSVKDLIGWAMQEGWLDAVDVEGSAPC